ncbi:conidiation protein 6 [Rhexocercosporidium sp. MPI-PUGE-AT-0058]|nr:conidiation protein 6 [Rhexocercosporidium sp. MPI-PUGE-AT-0058]
MEGLSPEDKSNIVRGHKAAISNPNVSDEAKSNSQNVIDELGNAHYGQENAKSKDEGNVLRGYKATISNPGVSDEAKQHAQQKLDEAGQ